MYLLATRDRGWMRQCEAALLAEGIESQWVAFVGARAMLLDVPVSDLERAADAVSALQGEERQTLVVPSPWVPLWLQPAFALGMVLALTTLAFFVVTGGVAQGGWWFQQGALFGLSAKAFEAHRLVTAATLHADAAHAVGNAAFFLVLGWGAGERLGTGLTVWVWLLTAVAGFAVSLAFSDATVTVGASGGLFGLLGASAGHAMRGKSTLGKKRQRLRAAGAGILLLAFTAFSARANVYAHVGGFAAGACLGLASPLVPLRGWFQGSLAVVSAAVIGVAWFLA